MGSTGEKKERKIKTSRRRRWPKVIFVILLFGFIAIQFFQPDKNNNSVTASNDISSIVEVPDTIQQLVKVACYDCHSNYTNYPWYTNIQPVGWWMNNHIEDAKRSLNFNEFANMPARNGKTTVERQLKKLDDIKEMLEEGKMPLFYYTFIHKEARLSKEQKQLIINWSDSASMKIEGIKN